MATKTTIITIFIIISRLLSSRFSRLLSSVNFFINPPQNGQNEATGVPYSMDNLGITFLWHLGQVTLWSSFFVSVSEVDISTLFAVNKLSFLLGDTSKVTEFPS